MSTGMANLSEIDDAVRTARGAGARDIVLLKCTSAYPADATNSNLATMQHLETMTGCVVGVSDHTSGIEVAIAAAALGARVIEKHVTLRRADGGVDSAFSLEPHELADLVSGAAKAWRAVGGVSYGPTESEITSLRFRRSLYVVTDVPEGGLLDRQNVRSIRPGFGLPPKYLDNVIGRRVRCAVRRGTPLSWQLLI
jgi:N-acetylneuraminate synthase